MNYAKAGKKLLGLVILVGLMALSISCAAHKIVLHPITGKDIYDGKNPGDVCFSEYYLNEVMQTKIEK